MKKLHLLCMTMLGALVLASCGSSKNKAVETRTEKSTSLEGEKIVVETAKLQGIDMVDDLSEDGTKMVKVAYKWYAGIGKANDKQTAIEMAELEARATISRVIENAVLAQSERGSVVNNGDVQKALVLFDDAGKPFFWLNVFGLEDNLIQQYLNKVHSKEQIVKSKLADLEYGTTYCVVCNADNFGKCYPKLQNEIKGELSASGCNFVDDPNQADYVIYIDASSREYNQVSNPGGNAYFSYVDASIAIDKKATGQRIFEDEISVKGSHTLSYDEAGRDGFRKISKEISEMLKENIKL